MPFYSAHSFPARSADLCLWQIVFLVISSCGQALAQESVQPQIPAFETIRWEEDYSYLSNDSGRVNGFFDPVKFIPLGRTRKSYLSIGGEVRYQYEYQRNANWGEGIQDKNGYLLQRYMLHTDLHLGQHVRIFGQLKSGIASGKASGPDPPDEDRLDLHQAFADLIFSHGSLQSTLRLGRQELSYGSSRLVSVREGPNVRQSFDAGRLMVKGRQWQADAFLSRPAETNRGIFDDGSQADVLFWGVYTTKEFPGFLNARADLYYLGLEDQKATFEQGKARELRHSAGLRLWSNQTLVGYNLEAVYQLGRFGRGRIQAWTASAELTCGLENLPWEPSLNLKTEIISGDHTSENPGLQTFNPLFPKGAYFGQVALIGPANLVDLHPSLTLQPAQNLELITDWNFFWRESHGDGLYGVPYVLIRESSGSRAAYIGDQLTFEADWQLQRHLQLEAFCTLFRTGSFLRQTGGGKNLTYLSTRITFKF